MTSVHQRTRTAVIWSALDVFMRQGMQFLVAIILARILSPEDFGLIAMLAMFVGVAGVFIDSGLGSALIQRQQVTHADESTIFFFNLAVAAVVSSLLCLFAPWIASFFSNPVLVYLTYAMAFNLFLGALGSIHTTLLTKEMNFRTIARAGWGASLVSGILAIILALNGFGVWSLVGQTVSASVVTVVLLWIWHPWRPSWTFNFASLRSYLRFGGYEMAANLTDAFSTNLNVILIGKLFSLRDAGFYDRAQKTQQFPVAIMMSIVNRVAFTAFSKDSKDREKLVRGLKKAQMVSMAINLPAVVSVIILAEPLVLTLFGEQWAAAVPILQVLAIVGLLWPLHVMNLSVLKAQGRADVFFWITILKKVVVISLTVAASFLGIMAIAWAQVIASFFAYLVNTHYSKVLLDYGAIKQIRDLSSLFVATIPMAIVMGLLMMWVEAPQPVRLLAIGSAGAITFWGACRLLCRETTSELLALAKAGTQSGR